MKQIRNIYWLAIILCLFVTACSDNGIEKMDVQETVFERVERTKILRCGYFIEAPFTVRDEKTGEMSGIAVDLMKKIAESYDLKIEWTEEIKFATFTQDLKNKRYDAVCGSIFVMPRGGQADYTIPYAYVPIEGYVKEGNKNFDRGYEDINWSNVKISGLDGEGATTAIQKKLPEAKLNILPSISNISEMLLSVDSGKSDIAFVLPTVFENFDRHNSGKLRKAKLDRPLTQYAVSFGIAPNQPAFKAMLDNAIINLQASGDLDMLFDQYDQQGHFKRPVLSR